MTRLPSSSSRTVESPFRSQAIGFCGSCISSPCSCSRKGTDLVADLEPLVHDACNPGIMERHRRRLPSSVGLHDVQTGSVLQGIHRPVVAQIMRRESEDAFLLAQLTHTCI